MIVEMSEARQRLDRWLADRWPTLSRARLQALIRDGRVRVAGVGRKAAYRVRPGDRIELDLPPPTPQALEPEARPLDIVYEDAAIIVVNKPAGMVVHPGAGQSRGTLAAAVLAHAPEIANVGGARRPGIVHRLDKGTSGLLVLAKSPAAYASLTAQLSARAVTRRYVAVVHGIVKPDAGRIDAPIGRHPHDRVRMAVRPSGQGKRAVTTFRVLERFARFSCTSLEARLLTGRTHQIRVHLAASGHPVVGDPTYGRGWSSPPFDIDGLALHAAELGFTHPETGHRVVFAVALPRRMERLLASLGGSRHLTVQSVATPLGGRIAEGNRRKLLGSRGLLNEGRGPDGTDIA